MLGAGVAVALYVAGRLYTPNYNFSLFGRVGLGAVMLKSTLASIALGAAVLQVLWPCGSTANCRWRATSLSQRSGQMPGGAQARYESR